MATMHGKYKCLHPEKYKGNRSKIEYRSSWELGFMRYCDTCEDVIQWNSEEIVIPYKSSHEQNRPRRYFVDFWVKYGNGKQYIFEVKPFKQTQPPIQPNNFSAEKAKKRFLNEIFTYNVNMDKWAAAKQTEAKNGWKFKILTEKTLPKFGVKC